VVLGSGVLSDTLLSGLRSEKQDLNKQITVLTDQRNALNEKLGAADQFDTQMSGRVVRDALAGKSVVLFRTPDADNDDVDAMARIIGQAGGTVSGTVALTQEFVDANSAEKLRSVVNSPILPAGAQLSTTLVDQGSQAGDLLGIALLINRNPEIKAGRRPAARHRAGRAARYRLLDLPGRSHRRCRHRRRHHRWVAGRQRRQSRLHGRPVRRGPGATRFGNHSRRADGSATGTSAVAVTRADAGMAAAVTTVDDIGIESGRITTVLALQNLIAGARSGQFGTGPGAGSITVPQ